MDRLWKFLARRIAPHLDWAAPAAVRTVILACGARVSVDPRAEILRRLEAARVR